MSLNTYYDAASHYVYDVSGNVKTLFQENTALKGVEGSAGNGIRQINYDYDLISGKVNKVVYQPGKGDQFIYRYEYDAENRIKIAYTSRNGLLWQQDAYYEYYQHGPLARVELGQHKVQGVDYAYTLQGWLKGINSVALDATKDMGGDGNAAGIYKTFGRDVYGYSLGYHSSDYKPIGGSAANAFAVTFTAPGSAGSGNTGAQLFNGNISHTTVALNKINSGAATGYSYLYDQLNRLLGMKQHNISGTSWSYSSFNTAYEEKFSYDANGNIKTLVRKGANITGMPPGMDNLKYYYYYTNTGNTRTEYDPMVALPSNVKSLSNQLARVTDSELSANYAEDIDSQLGGNYDYDNSGNLIKDVKEGITGVEWTVYGKIKQIKKGTVTINYGYDPSGNRIYKEVLGAPGGNTKQFYIRDAQGNTMALYNGKTTYVEWTEQHLYGSSRLGVWNYGKSIPDVPGAVSYDSMMIGSVSYELTNHLGNVLSVITDKKVGVSAGGTTVDYYRAEVLSQNDYYAFGSLMPGRKYSVANTNYRYGFNGMLKEVDVDGSENYYSTEYRQADVRVGRWWSLDPVSKTDITNYNMMSNNPIIMVDPNGDDDYYNQKGKYLYTDTKTSTDIKIISQASWDKINKNYSKAIADRSSSNLALLKALQQNSKTLTIKSASKDFQDLWTKSKGKEKTGYIVLDAEKAELSFKALEVEATTTSALDPYKAGDNFEGKPNQTVIANVHTHPEEDKYLGKFSDQQIFDAQYSEPGSDGNTAKARGARYTIGVKNVDYHSPKGKSESKNNLTSRSSLQAGKFNLLKHALEKYGNKK